MCSVLGRDSAEQKTKVIFVLVYSTGQRQGIMHLHLSINFFSSAIMNTFNSSNKRLSPAINVCKTQTHYTLLLTGIVHVYIHVCVC